MIPPFNDSGYLPAGVHWATWEEFSSRFKFSTKRVQLLAGLSKAIGVLKIAGCRLIYVDGSFVTSKELPNDYDACWDITNVDPMLLDSTFLKFDPLSRPALRKRFLGDLFPAQFSEAGGKEFLTFFQSDTQGNEKGIIGLKINR